jgi:predicted O-linked N-acetylglucosamine transferase (SPINDLY family)
MSAIDFRLSDPHLDPPDNDALYTERTLRLPAQLLVLFAAAVSGSARRRAAARPRMTRSRSRA